MKILVMNGPNLNLLGKREPGIYGRVTYPDLVQMCIDYGKQKGVEVACYQSNHEGDLVDQIQLADGQYDGIIINPGAYTHTSIALLDALKAVGLPAIEVHISKVEEREAFRQISYIRSYCFLTITGCGIQGYLQAIDALIDYVEKDGK